MRSTPTASLSCGGSGCGFGIATSPGSAAASGQGSRAPIRSRRTASAASSSWGAICGSPHPHHFVSRLGCKCALDPVECFVEYRALAAFQHPRAEPRKAPHRLHGADPDLGAAVHGPHPDLHLGPFEVLLERRSLELLLPDVALLLGGAEAAV